VSAAFTLPWFAAGPAALRLEARGLAAVARARTESGGVRLLATTIAAAVSASVLASAWPLAWLAGAVLVISTDRAIFGRIGRRLASGADVSAPDLLAWTTFQSTFGNLLAVMLWFAPDKVGVALAVAYLCGGLLNAAATLRPSTPLAIAGAGPTVAFLLGLPVIDFLFVAPRSSLELAPLVAALLLLGFGINLWRSLAASDRAVLAAEAAHAREQRAAAVAASARAELAARVQAELRGPMAALTGAIEQLRRAATTPGARLHAGGLAAIEDALAAALASACAAEGSEATTQRRPTNLRSLVYGVANAFRPAAEDKRLEIVVDVVDDAPQMVEIDAISVQRILFSLMSNAVRCTSHGGVRLRVCVTAAQPTDHVRLQFVVIDTGAGLSRSQLALIAEKRGPEDRSGGLAVCLRLAAAMGAKLSARSELGAGSAFGLTLDARVRRTLA
jgi:signal transduction histidine kinase